MKDNVQFLFIVGRGRSGTSLLQTILNTHHRIAVAPEAQFIMFLQKKYQRKILTPDVRKAFLKDLWQEKRLQNWNLDTYELEKSIIKLEKPSYAEICKEVYKAYGISKGKFNLKVVGDKNPHYALYLHKLIKIYPYAKFIHIVRDPRDTVLSYQKVKFDADSSAVLSYRWNIYNQKILNFKKHHPDQFYTLFFEDLLLYPEATLRKICRFLEVSYEPGMMEFYKYDQDWETNFRANLKRPLDPELAYRYKKQMPDKQWTTVSSITQNLCSYFGYETIDLSPGILRKALRIPFWLYAWWVVFLERTVYSLPLPVLSRIIAVYRKITAT